MSDKTERGRWGERQRETEGNEQFEREERTNDRYRWCRGDEVGKREREREREIRTNKKYHDEKRNITVET